MDPEAPDLILYAVPTGELAAQLAACSDGLATEAQRYPAHCTLTGFFHDADVERYVQAAASVVAPTTVDVVGLRADDGWVGLELHSTDLLALTDRFATAVGDPGSRGDAIRAKSWLHVSIAYGHDAAEHDALADRARALVDPTAACGWDLRLYERLAGDEWITHGSWPLTV
jgi:hypothetical protein